MADERKQKKCQHCGVKVLAIRPGVNHILHLLITILLCGFWLPIWALDTLKIGGWKCPMCGGNC